jgi:integrase
MWSGSSDSSVSTAYGLAKTSFPPAPKIASFLTNLAMNALRVDKKSNVPVVRTHEEVAAVLSLLDGTAPLVATLLSGSGVRIMEAVWNRVKDIDFQRKHLTVRSGTGDTDRCPTFPSTLTTVF